MEALNTSEQAPLLSDDDPVLHLYTRGVRKDASLWQCTVNVCQNVLGTGGLAVPAMMANGGLGGGLFALVLTACAASFTLITIGWLTYVLDGRNLQQLVVATMGKRAGHTCSALVLAFMWGANVLLLQFVRSNFDSLLVGMAGVWYCDGRFLTSMVALVVIFPLSMLPSFERLSYFSGIGVLLVCYSFGFVIVEACVFLAYNPPAATVEHGFNASLSFFLAFPTLVYSFMTHVSIVSMVAELERPTLARVSVVGVASMTFATCLYLLIGVLGYLRIGR
jgi:amino acid permease